MKREQVEKERYWTTFEAAKKLLVTSATIIKWIREGRLKTIRTLGGHRRIPDAEVQRVYKEMRSMTD